VCSANFRKMGFSETGNLRKPLSEKPTYRELATQSGSLRTDGSYKLPRQRIRRNRH